MSLIVSRKQGGKIYIVGDTRLNNPNNLNRVELPAPDCFAQIKTVMLNPHISVSFAGEWEPAKKALQRCRPLKYNFNEIVDYLIAVNRETNFETEFIVCACLTPGYIYEIKKGEKRLTESAWIGLQEGYNVFQESFHHAAKKEDVFTNMQEAMKRVIESNVLGVNGFMVAVSNPWQSFEYQGYVTDYLPPRTYGPGFHVMARGTVAEGGYTVNFMPSPQVDRVGVHIPQNRMGIVYKLGLEGILDPIVYRDVDEHEFADITERQYGFRPSHALSSRQTSCYERGNKKAEERQFKEALALYDQGLATTETHLLAELWYNKGVCYHHLGRLQDGMACFKEAVKRKPGMQAKAFQFIAMLASKGEGHLQ